MGCSKGLSPLQQDLLREFFARESAFVLTGGDALVGFHLRHRTSQDLDLFTKPPATIENGRLALQAAAHALGASIEPVRAYPEFQRHLCRRGTESVLVDLIDFRAILATGVDLTATLADAERKDAGVSAATLAWLLESLCIGPDAPLPGDVRPAELEAFRVDLVQRLRRLAMPNSRAPQQTSRNDTPPGSPPQAGPWPPRR